MPVTPSSTNWITEQDPERLVRSYEFASFDLLTYFIEELMKYQEEAQHHAKIIIDHRIVTIETYTHDFDGVTRQDTLLAKYADEIYSDTSFIRSRQNRD